MKYIILIASFFIIETCFAQDLIYKKDNTILKVTIVNIESETISFKEYNTNNGTVKTISKSELIKIQTASGKEILYEQGSSFLFDKKRAFKIDMFSWTSTKLTFSFEKSLKPGRSREYQIGLIGIGNKLVNVELVGGLFFRYGIKFIRSPEKYKKEGSTPHLLKGSYLRPEITLGGFTERTKVYDPFAYWYDPYVYKERSIVYAAAILNVGKQWVIADDYLIDYFFGMGLGYASNKAENVYSMVGPNPLFFQMGLKIGMMY